MKVCLALMIGALLLEATLVQCAQQQQTSGRILRRIVRKTGPHSAPRIKEVFSARFADDGAFGSPFADSHSFGKRSTGAEAQQQSQVKSPEKPELTTAPSKSTTSTTSKPTTTTSTTTSTTTQAPTTAATSVKILESRKETSNAAQESERQQLDASANVELMASAPSWQVMTAVAAPQIALESSVEETDFLRSAPTSGTKGGATKQKPAFFKTGQIQQQQRSKTSQQAVKTSNLQQTKTWYKPTTPRPEPIIQQQYEQQKVEQQVESAPLGQAEPFAFDFKTEDNNGNGQYRKEESDKDGVVRGSYGYTDANGMYRHVQYVADRDGFRANIKSNEPGMDDEKQPASIQLSAVETPKARLLAERNNKPVAAADPSPDWTSSSSNNRNEDAAEFGALIDPNFESSHKPERVVSDRLRQL